MTQTKRDPIDVLHGVLLKSPIGIAGSARLLGRSVGHMHNKFSEAMPHYEMTAREALAIAHAIPTTAYAEAIADAFGGVFMPLPDGMPADDDILAAYLDIVGKMGGLSNELTHARADGVIDPAEFAALDARAKQTVAAILHLLEDLRTVVREVPAPTVTLAARA